ncbi:MAG TPA: endonuclease/exonuclease/phosphatase family protein, partial [Paludibacter sp.]
EVFNKPFLTQQEGRYKGTPLRTHAGGAWTNGYSDHYPTLIYLVKEKK